MLLHTPVIPGNQVEGETVFNIGASAVAAAAL